MTGQRAGGRVTRSLVAAGLLAMVVAGCGSDDDSPGDESAPPADEQVEATGPVEGCGPEAVTDLEATAGHEPARCEPGAPAAEPLEEPTTITVAVANSRSENFAPLQIALEEGEFDAENLDVEFVDMPAADGLAQLAQGAVDVVWSGPDAGFHNLIAQDFDVRWAFSNFSSPPDSQSGLWAQAGTDAESLAGETIGSVIGPGSIVMLPIAQALDEAGISVDDVTIQQVPPADIVTALRNGSFTAAWITDPGWVQLVDDPDLEFLQGQPLGEPLGGALFGPTLVNDDREAGTAFTRAYIRTINTHFAGDYKADTAFVDRLAGILEVEPSVVLQTPSLVWDWEPRAGTTDRMQAVFRDLDAIQYPEDLPEDVTTDRSFYLAAVGHSE